MFGIPYERMTATAELDAELSTALDETLEHLNANHADTVLLIARYAAGCLEAEEAELAGIDSSGVDFDVVLGGRPDTDPLVVLGRHRLDRRCAGAPL